MTTPTCPRCGAPMRLITRRYRHGWECTRFWLDERTGMFETCETEAT